MTDWSEIVRQHGPAVWQTVFRMVGHDTDAADCFQQTFVSAVETARKQRVRHWPALLKRLAVARSLECLRRRYRASEASTVALESPAVDQSSVGPVQAAQHAELADRLRAALTELDERQAKVFCLACLDDLPYRTIAEQLGITVNHVGVLLNRARSNLRQRLRAFDPAAAPTAQPEPTP